jgi:hypothetical protein
MPGKNRGGRPRSALPQEIAERLGAPPIDKPLDLARWYQSGIALLTWEVTKGRPYAKLLETFRASAGAAGRVLPHDILFEAARILAADGDNLKSTDRGPALVKRENDPLRNAERKPSTASRRQPD